MLLLYVITTGLFLITGTSAQQGTTDLAAIASLTPGLNIDENHGLKHYRRLLNQTTMRITGWEHIFAYNRSNIIPLNFYEEKSYYMGYHIKATYLQAVQFCENIHMKLLSIRDENENSRIYKFIRDSNRGNAYWTSGAKLLDGHNWVWMSYGVSVEYTKWAPGQPDNNEEQCLQVRSTDGGIVWHDVKCDAKGFFICERYEPKRFSQIEDTESTRWYNLMQTPTISANIGLLHFNNKRYFFARHIKTNYMQAIQFCKLINMELVSITSKEENDRISKYIRDTNAGDHWWSSGSKLLDGKSWVWFTRGTAVEYTNWQQGEPNSETELCLHLVHNQNKGLEWTDDFCQYQYKVICETGTEVNNGGKIDRGLLIPIDPRHGGDDENQQSSQFTTSGTTSTTTSTTSRSIPVGGYNDGEWEKVIRENQPGFISFRYYEGKKYHVEVELIATQTQAAQFCAYHNMQLIEVRDKEENRLLKSFLLDTGTSGPYWTAGQKQGTSWLWSISQQPVTYTNWNRDKPSVRRQDRNCIQVDKETKWNDENCDTKLYFVCEAQMSSNTPIVVPDLSGQCAQPVVNVYIRTNLVTSEGERTLRKEILSSKDVAASDGLYQVQVNNNIDVSKKNEDNLIFRR